jgi:maleylacetoacetate isomerase
MDDPLVLHGYWRSTAAWRVRLALGAKGLTAAHVPVDLLAGDQRGDAHRALNPQGLVPVLIDGPLVLTQSLAIIEYLDETVPVPPLLPAGAAARALVRGAAMIVAAEIHPLGNLRVQRWLRGEMGQDEAAVTRWLHHWMTEGLAALDDFALRHGGTCLFGDTVTMADLCLLPQLFNARRFDLPLAGWPRLLAIEAGVSALPWAVAARPERQVDGPQADGPYALRGN